MARKEGRINFPGFETIEKFIIFEVLHYFIPVTDAIGSIQWCIKKGFQVIFFFPCSEGAGDLIEVQVAKKIGR